MFKNNNHTIEYYNIIKKAKERGDNYRSRYIAKKHLGYVETHHIIPSSIGGEDTRENIVWLTAYEHLKCHMLLTEMCENEGHRQKMLLAAIRMINKQDCKREREKLLPLQISDEDIQWLAQIRQDCAESHSKYMSERFKGEGNPFYGKKHTIESNQSRRDKLLGVPKSDIHRKNTSIGLRKVSDKISALVTGEKNPRYNPTQYEWNNIRTGETKIATRLEMITFDNTLKSNISQVINGNSKHVKGWRIISKE